MPYIKPDFNFVYNGKRLCLNDAADWAFTLGKLYDGVYDDILTNLNEMDEWEDSVFPWEKEKTEKKRTLSSRAKRSQRRKQNKKHHKADRYHGKCFEGRDEEGRRIYKDRYTRFPVLDKVRYKSALKTEAREQDYLAEISAEISEKEKIFLEEIDWEEMDKKTEEEHDNLILNNHYALGRKIPAFGNKKYIALLTFYNGERCDEFCSVHDQFQGIKTVEQIKDAVLTEQVYHDSLPTIKVDDIYGIIGTSFTWEDYYGNEDGYVELTFLPI